MAGRSTEFTARINVVTNVGDAVNNIKNIQNALNGIKLPDTIKNSLGDKFKSFYKEAEKYQNMVARGPKTKGEASTLERSGEKVLKIYEDIAKEINSIDNKTLKNAFKDMGGAEVERLKKSLEDAKNSLSDLAKNTDFGKKLAIDNTLEKSLKSADIEMSKLEGDASKLAQSLKTSTFKTFTNNFNNGRLDLAAKNLESIREQVNNLAEGTKGKNELKQWIDNLINGFNQMKQSDGIQSAIQKMTELKGSLSGAAAEAINNLIQQFQQMGGAANQSAEGLRKVITTSSELGKQTANLNTEMNQLQNRFMYFFGLANGFNLIKRAIRSAINTVKDLDKAMTATAVVTNYTIEDMWKQLPEYTKRAKELGITTQAAYESATLFYQQGLNTRQAAELSTETLKMARIAGLDAAEATDRMTNALRGFNMELNATSAQKVDDVYSKLAAMSASNVDEISTAMTKVASLASNANMSFENTSAFLAKIIESTRESAETAGTALKTVIARFSEVKELYSKDQLTGEDSEGEAIDVNKIAKALRTAGIDLNKYFLGEVGLDDIFMELAAKWDSLTNVQQRYIATQAAGSRQQSRFIALMQDNARTLELVNGAYTSSGAAEEQFEKTQDSMESKLAKLKDTWDEFIMGLTNNTIIKAGIDLLNGILETVNKITGAFGDGIGTILKWGAAIGSFMGIKKGLGAIFGSMTAKAGAKFRNGFLGEEDTKEKASKNSSGNTFFNKVKQAAEVFFKTITGSAKQAATTEQTGTKSKIATEQAGTKSKIAEEQAGTDSKIAKEQVGTDSKIATEQASIAEQIAMEQTALEFREHTLTEGVIQREATLSNGVKVRESVINGQVVQREAIQTDGTVTRETLEENGTITRETWKDNEVIRQEGIKDTGEFKRQSNMTLGTKQREAIQNAGAAKRSAGQVLGGLLKSFGPMLAISIGAALLPTIIGWFKELGKSTEEKLQEKVTRANEINNAAQQNKDNIKEILKEYTEKTEAIKNASTLEEEQEAISERSQYVISVIEENDNLIQYLQILEDGQYTFEQKQLEYLSQIAENTAKETSSLVLFNKGNLAYEQYRNYRTKSTSLSEEDEEEKKLKTRYDINASRKINEAFNYLQAGFEQSLDAAGIEKDLAKMIATSMAFSPNLFTTNDNDELYELLSDEEKLEWLTFANANKSKRKKLFQEKFGYSPDNLEEDEIKQAYYDSIMQRHEVERGKEIEDLMKSDEDYYKIVKYFSGLSNLDLDQNAEEIINSFSNDKLQKLSALYNYQNVDDFKASLVQGIEAAQRDTARKIGNLTVKAIKSSKFSKELGNNIAKLNIDKLVPLDRITTKLEEVFDEDQIGDFLSKAVEYNVDDLNEIQTFINTLDFENPLSALRKINEAIDSGSDKIQKLAREIKETNKDTLFDQGYLTQLFFTSETFIQLNEELKKLYEENKQIAGSDIENLRSEYSELNKLIVEAGISANALAQAFTALQNGAKTEGISTSVLKALENTKTATSAIEEYHKKIDEFDEGLELKKGYNFVSDALENFNETLEKGLFGDPKFKNYFKEIFGDDEYKEFKKKDIVQQREYLKNKTTGFKALFDSDAVLALDLIKDAKIGKIDENGWDIGTRDYEQLSKEIESKLGVTETIAKAIINVAGQHFPNLMDDLDLNSFNKAIRDFYNNLEADSVATEEELEAIAKAYGFTVKEAKAKFNEFNNDKKNNQVKVYVTWYDEKGNPLSGEKIYEKINENNNYKTIFNNIEKEIRGFIGSNTSYSFAWTYDAEEFISLIQNQFKVNRAQAEEVVNEYVSSNNSLLTKTVKYMDETGKVVQETVKGKNLEELNLRVENLLKQNDWEKQANIIADGIMNALNSEDFEGKIQLDIIGENGNSLKDTVQDTLNAGGSYKIKINGIVLGIGKEDQSDNSQGGATGGYVPSFAGGGRKLKPGIALTGEEGPELIWNKNQGYARFVGINGPEFTNLQSGDQVFPADETKKIANRGTIPSYNEGTDDDWHSLFGFIAPTSSGSGKQIGDIDLDKYYNLVEDINELLRLREDLETKYNRLLQSENKSGKLIYDNLKQQLKILEERREITEFLAKQRKQQLDNLVEENQKYSRYVWWNDSDQTIEINWDEINALQESQRTEITDYLSKLEEAQSAYDDILKELEEIEDSVIDLKKRGRDQYTSLEDKIRDALMQKIQNQIEELTSSNEGINTANQNLLKSIQDNLSLQRQQRDNAKTEEDISKKEQRLAYLQQDSSNANALEIAKLQEELQDARQSYTDKLIDQKINELQKQNDEAAQQRQDQIDLLQQQLDWQEKSGVFWDQVYQIMNDGIGPNGTLVTGSELEQLLKQGEGWQALSEEGKMNWLDELETMVAEAVGYLYLSRQLENIGTKDQTQITFTNAEGQVLTGTVDKNGNVVVDNGDGTKTTYKNVYQSYDGTYHTMETEAEALKDEVPITNTGESNGPVLKPPSSPPPPDDTDIPWSYDKVEHYKEKAGVKIKRGVHKFDPKTNVCKICGYHRFSGGGTEFATGGLNTETGPAWLDGTKSHPELVLNARDTENFIQLKDHLATLRQMSTNGLLGAGGDNYYDIDVHVDSLGSDYDVDMAIDRIKARIYQDGAYRNVNTLNRLR